MAMVLACSTCSPSRTVCSSNRLHYSDSISSSIQFRSSFSGRTMNLKKQQIKHSAHSKRLIIQSRALEQLKLGAPPPNFQLVEPSTGKEWQLSDFEKYPALLVMFTSYRCPFVVFLRSAILQLLEEYMEKGLGVVAISPNSVITFPEDGPAEMQQEVEKYGYKFPYLYDETQQVTMAYAPLGTPDFFLFKKDEGKSFELAYHGQFDDARPHSSKVPITGKDLRAAIECILSGKPPDPNPKHSMGCGIQWHPHLYDVIYPKPVPDVDTENRLWLT